MTHLRNLTRHLRSLKPPPTTVHTVSIRVAFPALLKGSGVSVIMDTPGFDEETTSDDATPFYLGHVQGALAWASSVVHVINDTCVAQGALGHANNRRLVRMIKEARQGSTRSVCVSVRLQPTERGAAARFDAVQSTILGWYAASAGNETAYDLGKDHCCRMDPRVYLTDVGGLPPMEDGEEWDPWAFAFRAAGKRTEVFQGTAEQVRVVNDFSGVPRLSVSVRDACMEYISRNLRDTFERLLKTLDRIIGDKCGDGEKQKALYQFLVAYIDELTAQYPVPEGKDRVQGFFLGLLVATVASPIAFYVILTQPAAQLRLRGVTELQKKYKEKGIADRTITSSVSESFFKVLGKLLIFQGFQGMDSEIISRQKVDHAFMAHEKQHWEDMLRSLSVPLSDLIDVAQTLGALRFTIGVWLMHPAPGM